MDTKEAIRRIELILVPYPCSQKFPPKTYKALNMAIEALKQPEIIYCKDCKHWKDSDGVYRRGFDAESKCPLNIHQVYEGTFYCSFAERRIDDRQGVN